MSIEMSRDTFNQFGFTDRTAHDVRIMPRPHLTISAYAEIAAMAAALAGPHIRAGYQACSSFEAKGIGDFVTETDRAAEHAIIEYLQGATPAIPIISEEGCGSTLPTSGPAWIVDPLDGTSAFIFKSDPSHPAVMVALLDNAVPVVSIVYLPLVERWFYAEKGKGAWMFDGASPSHNSTLLTALQAPHTLGGAQVVMNHYGNSMYETDFFRAASRLLRGPQGAALVTIEAPNSAVSCRMLAPHSPVVAVIHDNQLAKIKQEVWDIAPVLLIVEEAGGLVSDQFGDRYVIGSGGPILISRNAEVHRQLVTLLGNTSSPKTFLEPPPTRE